MPSTARRIEAIDDVQQNLDDFINLKSQKRDAALVVLPKPKIFLTNMSIEDKTDFIIEAVDLNPVYNMRGAFATQNFKNTFGIEIEVKRGNGDEIARKFFEAGLSNYDKKLSYHARSFNSPITRARIPIDGWSVTSDSSVDNEIVSPILNDSPKSWGAIKTVCKILEECGCQIDDCCSAHVHVGYDVLGIDKHNWRRLFKIYGLAEDFSYLVAAGDQGVLRYAARDRFAVPVRNRFLEKCDKFNLYKAKLNGYRIQLLENNLFEVFPVGQYALRTEIYCCDDGVTGRYYLKIKKSSHENPNEALIELQQFLDDNFTQNYCDVMGCLKRESYLNIVRTFSNARYDGLNVSHIGTDTLPTMEFRIFNGSMNPLILQNNVQYCMALLRAAKEICATSKDRLIRKRATFLENPVHVDFNATSSDKFYNYIFEYLDLIFDSDKTNKKRVLHYLLTNHRTFKGLMDARRSCSYTPESFREKVKNILTGQEA